ncbi:hypothetical protein EVAR_52854_1 [Eumeta japonica]|uniref:Uncharacterized protein n=1 Tax=Eumeta variegata TaxID=151549 RepID=A0A4C1YBG3_EUMVA|nr:hypothetical protein EVAR_52854_1 [Eumeta japonica]
MDAHAHSPCQSSTKRSKPLSNIKDIVRGHNRGGRRAARLTAPALIIQLTAAACSGLAVAPRGFVHFCGRVPQVQWKSAYTSKVCSF